MTPEYRKIYAGMMAASSVAVAKQLPMRDGPPAALPPRMRPSSLSDAAALFNEEDLNRPARRVARLSSAALLCSVNKRSERQPARLLHHDSEKRALSRLEPSRKNSQADRSCPHCRLLRNSLYGDLKWHPFPPVAIVNHKARVNIEFDPDSGISKAEIRNFQVMIPETIAREMLRRSHPLDWSNFPESIFRRSDPVNQQGRRLPGTNEEVRRTWEGAAVRNAFVYEDVAWPVNQDISADSENVIRVSDFHRPEDKPGEGKLSYRYSLERCVRTNFGIAWEPSGLDIDGGEYDGSYRSAGAFTEEDAGRNNKGEPTGLLGGLTKRDLLEMEALLEGPDGDNSSEKLHAGWPDTDSVSPREIIETIKRVGQALADRWRVDFVLANITASKALHFTVPENGPVELWQSLTYTAPAMLFTFLNAAVCHTPHLIIQQQFAEPGGEVFHGRK